MVSESDVVAQQATICSKEEELKEESSSLHRKRVNRLPFFLVVGEWRDSSLLFSSLGSTLMIFPLLLSYT